MDDLLDDTGQTLLNCIRHDANDQAAWETFVACSGARINSWCRHRGLQPPDAEDVTQNVMLRVARALETFTYDPSKTFAGWLRRITENALSDFFLDRKRRPGAYASSEHTLETVQAHDELEVRLEQEFASKIVSHASTVVRTKVEPRTWEAFRLTAYEGRTGDDVAMRLGMAVATVFKAKSRVLSLMRKEVMRLDAKH
jgi:RNA polymerase sigma factor (sigma-70 family)